MPRHRNANAAALRSNRFAQRIVPSAKVYDRHNTNREIQDMRSERVNFEITVVNTVFSDGSVVSDVLLMDRACGDNAVFEMNNAGDANTFANELFGLISRYTTDTAVLCTPIEG